MNEIDGKQSPSYPLLGTDALAWDAVRLAKNSVVALVRTGLRGAGIDIDSEVPKLFVKEWAEVTRQASASQARGLTTRKHEDALDLVGINHVATLLEKYGLVVLESICPDPDERRLVRTQLKAFATELTFVRNPMAHPPTTDLPIRDALRYLDTAARAAQLVHDVETSTKIVATWQELVSSLPDHPELPAAIDNLPSRESITNEFIGRSDELRHLFNWLEDPDRFVWVLAGDGGKGKTTIAYEFARQVRPILDSYKLAGVSWLSAKQRRYVEGQTVPILDPDFSDLKSALVKLLLILGFNEDDIAGMDVKEMQTNVTSMLTDFPMLLVIDDIDSLADTEEGAVELFTYLLPNRTRSKVLITSRRKLFGLGGATTDVAGLTPDEVGELIRRRLATYGLTAVADGLKNAQVRTITNITDGSPLYVEDLVRLAAVLGLPQAISEWSGRKGESAREYALKRELEILSEAARQALGVLAYSEVALSAAEVAEVLGQSIDDTGPLLGELQSWNLVGAPPLIDDVPRFECGRNLSKLFKRIHEGSDEEIRIRNALKGLRGLSLRSSEVRVYIQQAVALKKRGELEAAEETLLTADRDVPNSSDVNAMLGWLYATWQPAPRVTESRERFSRAYELRNTNREMLFHWAQLEKGQREFRKALELLDKAAEQDEASGVQNTYLMRLQAETLIELACLCRQSLKADDAESFFRRAERVSFLSLRLEMDRRPMDSVLVSRTFDLLSRLFEQWGKADRRNDVLNQWGALLPNDPWKAQVDRR